MAATIAGILLFHTDLVVASPLTSLEPDRLWQGSDQIVEGTVVEQRVQVGPRGLLQTVSTVQVEACQLAPCPEQATVVQWGGEKDGVGLVVSGVTPLKRKARYVLFLQSHSTRYHIVGRDLGTFEVASTNAGVMVEGTSSKRALEGGIRLRIRMSKLQFAQEYGLNLRQP